MGEGQLLASQASTGGSNDYHGPANLSEFYVEYSRLFLPYKHAV